MLAPQEIVVVGERAVRVCYEYPAELPPPPPRVALGLSPCPLREVGAVGDGVPFCSTAPKPRAAMQRYDLRGLLRRDRHAPQAKVDSGLRPGGRPCDQYPCEPDVAPCCMECSPDGEHERTIYNRHDQLNEAAEIAGETVQRLLTPLTPEVIHGVVIKPEDASENGDSSEDSSGEPSESLFSLSPGISNISPLSKDIPLKTPNDERERFLQITDISSGGGGGDGAQPRAHAQGSIGASGTQQRGANARMSTDSDTANERRVSFSKYHAKKENVSGRSSQLGASRAITNLSSTVAGLAGIHKTLRLPSTLLNSKSQSLSKLKPLLTSSSDSASFSSPSRFPAPLPSLKGFSSSSSSEELSPRQRKHEKEPKKKSANSTKANSVTIMRSSRKCQRPAPSSSPLEPRGTLVLTPAWQPRTTCFVSLVTEPGNPIASHYRSTSKCSGRDTKSEGDIDSDSDQQLAGTQSAPESPQVTTSVAMQAASISAMLPAKAAQSQQQQAPPLAHSGRNLRCEALRWARGEPLHAHCAFVAFPNDTQRSLRPWPDNRLTRSIFTSTARYAAPHDPNEALSAEQLLVRVAQADTVRRELRVRSAQKRAVADARSLTRPALPEYEVSDPTLYNFRQFRPATAPPAVGVPTRPLVSRSHALVPLMPRQLVNVRLAPPQVNFGIVGAKSHVNSKLVVENGNEVPVKVKVHSPQSSITVPGDGVVYVPPHGKAELTVTLYPEDLGDYNGMLQYVVNDSHEFQAPVTAEVVLPSLILPTTSLCFGFVHGCNEPWPQLVHVITVENPLQAAAHFEWIAVEKTCYEVVPQYGEVPPRGTCACEVRYRSNYDAQTSDAELLLASANDNYLPLSCRLLMPLNTKTLNAGFVKPFLKLPSLSLLRRRRFVLQIYNATFLETLFKSVDGGSGVVNEAGKGENGCVMWRLRPVRGVLPPRSLRLLILTVRALRPGPLRFELCLALGQDAFAPPTAEPSTRKHLKVSRAETHKIWGKVTVQTITANVVCPNVIVNPGEVRLNRVPEGGLASATLTFQNVGAVEATVRMVETDEVSRDDWALSLKADRLERPDEPLMLPPRSPPVELFLLFRPMDIASYEFLLPLQLNSGIGPPRINDPASVCQDSYLPGVTQGCLHPAPKLPCVRVDATVSRKLLDFSETEFNFLYSAIDPGPNVIRHRLRVENVTNQRVFMWIPEELLADEPFSINVHQRPCTSDPVETHHSFSETSMAALHKLLAELRTTQTSLGSCDDSRSIQSADLSKISSESSEDGLVPHVLVCLIAPRQTCTFELNFNPCEPGSYSVAVPVFVNGRCEEDPLLYLMLDGVFYRPTLTASVDEIILSPRPLNVPTEVRLWIEIAHHEEDSTISWHCEHKFSEGERAAPKDCLKVVMVKSFVPRKTATKKLSATVVFKAVRPLGVRARIVFSSGPPPYGATCSVPVTVMADCSLLTTHAFLPLLVPPFPPARTPPTLASTPRSSGRTNRRRKRRPSKRLLLHFGTLHSDEEVDEATDEGDDWSPLVNINATLSITSTLSAVSVTSTTANQPATTSAAAMPLKVEPMTSTLAFATVPKSSPQTSATGFASAPEPAAESVSAHAKTTPMQSASTKRQSVSLELLKPTDVKGMPLSRSSLGRNGTSHAEKELVCAPGNTIKETKSASPLSWNMQMTSHGTVPSRRDERPTQRFRRGSSRCNPNIALVDADVDSLGSSEDSEGGMSISQYGMETAAASNIEDSKNVFPYFPDRKDISEYAVYMRRMQLAMQEWLYDVICRHEYWCTLPDGFNQLYRLGRNRQTDNAGQGAKNNEKDETNCPFDVNTACLAFINLAGQEAFEYIIQRFPDVGCVFKEWWEISGCQYDLLRNSPICGFDDDINFQNYAQLMVRRMASLLHMMRLRGAVLPHVRPEYLIDYCRYQALRRRSGQRRDSSVSGSRRSSTVPMINIGEVTSSRNDWHVGSEYDLEVESWYRDPDAKFFIAGPLLSKHSHRRLSRQAWLDVTIQWARIYWLPKIDEEHNRATEAVYTMHAEPGIPDPEQTAANVEVRSMQYRLASAARYSDAELSLLAWLNERFSRVRLTLCQGAGAPPPRFVTTFDQDLADGVVLAAATLDVCPFLREYLPDLHPEPSDINQAQHNAARLVSAWNAARLGFTVRVNDIVHPLAVKMLLLVAHLYNVLPGISASHTLRLSSSLATHASESLALVNPSKFHMQYLAEFIGDAESFFSILGGSIPGVPCNNTEVGRTGKVFSLQPEERLNLQVRFHARTLAKKSCTLLLTGMMEAPNFGRALALRLEGYISSFDVTHTLHVSSPLCQPIKTVLELPLPYSSRNLDEMPVPTFELLMGHTKPTIGRVFADKSWEKMRKRKVLHRLFLHQTSTEMSPPEKNIPSKSLLLGSGKMKNRRPSTADVSVTLCAFTPHKRNYWIGCVSPRVGDFIIKVVSRSTKGLSLGTLNLPLPLGWRLATCTCGGRFTEETLSAPVRCPLLTQVLVPCRNRDLWFSAATMFQMTLDDTEKAFWKEHLDTNIGIQIMQWVLEKNCPDVSDEYAHIFNTSVVYRVSLSGTQLVKAPAEFFISDVRADETVALAVHVGNNATEDLAARLQLRSTDGREIRDYWLRAQLPPVEETELKADRTSHKLRKTASEMSPATMIVGSTAGARTFTNKEGKTQSPKS